MIAPLQSNEMDRCRFELDPSTLTPLPNKVVIKRRVTEDTHKGLFLPQNSKAKRPLFEGWIVKLGAEPPDECPDLKVSDHVWFSYQVGADDSAFFDFDGEHFAIVPFEAIQMIEEAFA